MLKTSEQRIGSCNFINLKKQKRIKSYRFDNFFSRPTSTVDRNRRAIFFLIQKILLWINTEYCRRFLRESIINLHNEKQRQVLVLAHLAASIDAVL